MRLISACHDLGGGEKDRNIPRKAGQRAWEAKPGGGGERCRETSCGAQPGPGPDEDNTLKKAGCLPGGTCFLLRSLYPRGSGDAILPFYPPGICSDGIPCGIYFCNSRRLSGISGGVFWLSSFLVGLYVVISGKGRIRHQVTT